MRIIVLFMLIFNVQFSIAQINKDTSITVSAGLGINRVEERQKKITEFADSLNNYAGGTLPYFLFNECFDNQSNLWEGFHSPVSLRWRVLEQVHNKEALKRILAQHDKRLNRKCRYDNGVNLEFTIPMINKSFHQLLLKRQRQLQTKAFGHSTSIDNWFGEEKKFDNGFDVNQYDGDFVGIKWKY